jgi:hypothetical protein
VDRESGLVEIARHRQAHHAGPQECQVGHQRWLPAVATG